MRVLIVTGDRRFGSGHQRYELQKSAVDELEVVYWGRGSAGWRMWPKIPKGSFDVVTVQDPFWRGVFGWYVARHLKTKFNVQVHTDPSAHSFFRRLLAQFVIRRADSVRVVSEKIKHQITHPRITVLPVFVDVEKFRKIERHPEVNTILWIGRFEPEKDPLFALEIAKEIPDAKLIMLGAGSLERSLRTFEERLNLAGRVEFVGWQDPMPFLARAKVVLSTSKHESWGESIIEALASGVPVVAPDVGVAREAGAIVVPRKSLAEAVKTLLHTGGVGKLQISLLDARRWAEAWKQSLI